MNKDWNHIIHKFINHSLTREDKIIFDQLYKENEDFRSEVEMITDIQVVIESNDYNNLKVIMEEAESEISIRDKQGFKRFLKKGWIIIIVLLIVLFAGYHLLKPKPSPSQLYASYYKAPANTFYPITRGNADISTISKAFLAYEQKDYRNAQQLLSTISPNDEINFYLAISTGELEEYEEAINLLNRINSKDPLLQEDVWWYKGLFHLAQSDKTAAMSSFQNIETTTNEERRQLLNELRE